MKRVFLFVLGLLMAVCVCACGSTGTGGGDSTENALWTNALYTEDTTLGSGNKSFRIEVKAEDKSVVFTVNTDADTVGEALIEQGILEAEDMGTWLSIKSVNGITADFEVDKMYWAFYINGEYADSPVDQTAITEGVEYGFERQS